MRISGTEPLSVILRQTKCKFVVLLSNCWDQFSRLFTDLMTTPNLTFTELRGFHGAFATGVACQQGGLTLPDTWFRSYPLLGTCLCSNCWYQFSRTCLVFSRLFTLNTPRYFVDFASKYFGKILAARSFCTSFGKSFPDEGSLPVTRVWHILFI